MLEVDPDIALGAVPPGKKLPTLAVGTAAAEVFAEAVTLPMPAAAAEVPGWADCSVLDVSAVELLVGKSCSNWLWKIAMELR